MKQSLYILGVIALLVSCKKTQVESLPPTNDPVFEVSGEFDNLPLRFVAGDFGMSVQTETEIRNGVRYFSAILTNGEIGLKLGFFDDFLTNQYRSLDLYSGDTLILASKFNEPLAVLSKEGFSNADRISSIEWSIDGTVVGENTATIYEPGVYEVCGSFMYNDGVHRYMCNTMYLGFDSSSDEVIRSFAAENAPAKVWLEEQVKDIDFVEWRLNGDLISNESSCSVDLLNAPHGKVEASIHHLDGSVRTKGVMLDGAVQGNYVEDFDIFLQDPNLRQWNKKVGVEVINGNQQFSSFLDDNYKNRLIIESIEEYEC